METLTATAYRKGRSRLWGLFWAKRCRLGCRCIARDQLTPAVLCILYQGLLLEDAGNYGRQCFVTWYGVQDLLTGYCIRPGPSANIDGHGIKGLATDTGPATTKA